uniref:Uncharacterized protein n=1 Tax=Rhizophora mucronata TaxID=61149 RepID=A0A2P2N1C8_RHIMU
MCCDMAVKLQYKVSIAMVFLHSNIPLLFTLLLCSTSTRKFNGNNQLTIILINIKLKMSRLNFTMLNFYAANLECDWLIMRWTIH